LPLCCSSVAPSAARGASINLTRSPPPRSSCCGTAAPMLATLHARMLV
jgi:hypothetical protein